MKLNNILEDIRIAAFGTPMDPNRVDDYVFAYVVPPMDYAEPHEAALLFRAPQNVSYIDARKAFRDFERRTRIHHGKAMVTNQYFIDNNGIPSKQSVLDTN